MILECASIYIIGNSKIFMRTLIVGAGEIGKSLYSIFSKMYETEMIDKGDVSAIRPEIMHIAIPYSDKFVEIVREYKERYNPRYIVNHSTVPAGTSRKCGAVHSPVIGIHPHLAESIKTFVKYLGGKDASHVADYFRRAGIKVYITDKPEATETIKALSTSFYGMTIEFTKEVKRICNERGIPFELWTLWTESYNQGYEKLGYPEYRRPNLIPIVKDIGGHCVLPNLNFVDSPFSELIKKLNKKE